MITKILNLVDKSYTVSVAIAGMSVCAAITAYSISTIRKYARSAFGSSKKKVTETKKTKKVEVKA